MPTPATRTPLRVARGTYSNLNSSISDIQEGEICYATDQDKLYVKEGSSLVPTLPATNAVTDAVQTFSAAQRGTISTLMPIGNTVTPNFAASNNYTITLGGNRTIANPTNIVEGQSGSIFIVQDSTGNRTAAWGSYWEFAGGVRLCSRLGWCCRSYRLVVRSTNSIHAVATLAYS